ncbi:MAG: Ig-like domain-containing protein [Clostridiales bacterium]|nr:Ig-like domain-containing protein [Clostridiales bacterium]MDD7035874.1 Ig-like domain-containing protein [Bacillota bacterium]MDY2920114.1 Ig-like domain-containing protein [Lentihominibacter sp.]
MKKLSALVCIIMMTCLLAVPVLAGADAVSAETKSSLTIEETSPEAGSDGVAVDNFSVKVRFNKDVLPASKKVRKTNAKQVKMVDSEGTRIPVKVYYSDEEEGLILIAADNFDNKDKQIKGNEEYTLTVGGKFTATDGTTLGKKARLEYKTLNQQRSTAVYFVLMLVMMGGMIFFTMKSAKKEAEKEAKAAQEHVNPYKEAKRTGKSVEEIVEKEQKKKLKKEEEEAKRREYREQLEAEVLEKMRKESNKRVSAPKSISTAGSSYKVKVVSSSGEELTPKASVAATYKKTKTAKKPVKKKGGKKKKK